MRARLGDALRICEGLAEPRVAVVSFLTQKRFESVDARAAIWVVDAHQQRQPACGVPSGVYSLFGRTRMVFVLLWSRIAQAPSGHLLPQRARPPLLDPRNVEVAAGRPPAHARSAEALRPLLAIAAASETAFVCFLASRPLDPDVSHWRFGSLATRTPPRNNVVNNKKHTDTRSNNNTHHKEQQDTATITARAQRHNSQLPSHFEGSSTNHYARSFVGDVALCSPLQENLQGKKRCRVC